LGGKSLRVAKSQDDAEVPERRQTGSASFPVMAQNPFPFSAPLALLVTHFGDVRNWFACV
jgi:hypothetical protein